MGLYLFVVGSLGFGQTAAALARPETLTFEVQMAYTPDGDIILYYSLSNHGTTPFVVDPGKLSIWYGEVSMPYALERSPAPGRANRLSPNETEKGILTIFNPPYDSDNLQLSWQIFEIGPGVYHTLLRTFADIATESHD